MIEHQKMYGSRCYYGSLGIKDTTPQRWSDAKPVFRKFKRPLLSYRGKVWCWIAIGLAAFWSIGYAVVQELTR